MTLKYNAILGIDPSGNFTEGKGTTGFVLLDKNLKILEHGEIKADDFKEQGEYWERHIEIIDTLADKDTAIVVEDYLLYAHTADSQIGSRMETPQLLGVIKHYCWQHGLDLNFQKAVAVKNRWNDEILEHKGYLMKTKNNRYLLLPTGSTSNGHIRDALRHAVHFVTFYNKE